MRRGGPGRLRAGVVSIAWLITAAFGVLFAAPAGAVIDDPDIDSQADYLYEINTADGVVGVRIDLTITADKPDATSDDGVFQYYFRGYSMLIPAEAENLSITDSSGTTLSFERDQNDESDETDLVSINFRRNIFFRQSTRIVIEFSLAAGAPGSDNIARINPAYASFVAWTSPIIEEATVTIVVPPGFEDRSTGPQPFALELDESQQRLVASNVDPESYYAVVSVANDDALDDDVLELGDGSLGQSLSDDDAPTSVRVRSWPGDDGWRDHVIEGVNAGLPRLADLVGQPWPIEDDLTITESFAPYLYGYAGWYDPETDIIEVGDKQDDHVLYHELSHVWFNRELFGQRWITEGLADFYSAETIESIGGDRPQPLETSPLDADAIPLLEFADPGSPEEELWAYSASWNLMNRVVDEIGVEGLSQVVDAAADRQFSYLGDVEPETVLTVADWRRFLDLVENQQGVVAGPVADLVDEWVIGPNQAKTLGADLLDDRAEARARYFALVDDGDSWAPPFGVRDAMMLWRFPNAADLMAQSEALLADRDALLATVGPAGAALPANLETLYEEMDESDTEIAEALSQAASGGAAVREAHDKATAERSLLQRVGLIGADLDAEMTESVSAFGAGRLTAAIAQADEVDELVDGSNRNGLLRIGGLIVVLLVIGVGLWFGIIRPRRRRPTTATTATTGTNVSAADSIDPPGAMQWPPAAVSDEPVAPAVEGDVVPTPPRRPLPDAWLPPSAGPG